MASRGDCPFFQAVSAMEWIAWKASAPVSDRKHPDICCFTFNFRVPLSEACYLMVSPGSQGS